MKQSIKKNVFTSVIKQIFYMAFLAFGALAFVVSGQSTNQNIVPLAVNKTVEKEIKAGEEHLYSLELKEGRVLTLDLEEGTGVNYIFRLIRANANQKIVDSDLTQTFGRETITYIASTKENLKVLIKAPDKINGVGRYKLTGKISKKAAELYKETVRAEELSREAVKISNDALKLPEKDRKDSYQKAAKLAEEALNLRIKQSDKYWQVWSLNLLAITNNNLGDRKKALDLYNQALQTIEPQNTTLEAKILLNSAYLYYISDDRAKSLENNNKALEIFRKLKEVELEVSTLRILANNYLFWKEETKAIESYKQALELYRKLKDKTNEALMLENIGSLYNRERQKEIAKDYYEQALVIYRESKNKKGEAQVLRELGFLYGDFQQFDQELTSFERLLTLTRELKDKNGEADTLDYLAFLLGKAGQYGKAKNLYEQALIIWRELKNRNDNKLGLGMLKLLSNSENRVYLPTTAFRIQYNEAATLKNLMQLELKLNNKQLSIVFGKQAVNVLQEIRNNNIKNLDKERQKVFLDSEGATYRFLANLLIGEGRFPEAQAVLDLLKEEEFKQIVRRSGGETVYTLPYSKGEEEALKIVDKLAVLGKELSDLRSKPKESLTAEEAKRFNELEFTEIPAANRALKQATKELSTVAPDVKNALDLKMKENIQTTLPALGRNVVALYTVVGKANADDAEGKNTNSKVNIGWILLVTPEFRKAYPIDTENLEQTVFKLRESLRTPNYDPQPLAEELYKKLFRQTSPKLNRTLEQDLEETLGKYKDKVLMWSLDGVLRYIPIAALHDGKQYLVEKYRNTVFNTASLGSLKDSVNPNWEITGLGISTEGTVKAADGAMLKFSALKGSEAELNSIVKEKNRADDKDGIFLGTLKINGEFTKEALFEGARAKTPVIHISSHFWFNPVKEETSFLLLGNGAKIEMTEFEDYPNLFQNVDFLSLSACDTATGTAANFTDAAKETNGKEVEGFAYKAQTLGAKSVLASLWQVSDRGTKELMLEFYRIRKQQPETTKAEALRQAQLSLLKGTIKSEETTAADRGLELVRLESGFKPFKKDASKPFAHPFYWSPFILIGNWK